MDMYDFIYLISSIFTIVFQGFGIIVLSCLLTEYRLDRITWLRKNK